MKIYFFILLLAISPMPASSGDSGLPWQSGFETLDLSEWSDAIDLQGEMVLTDESPHTGSACLRATLQSGNSNESYADFYFGDHLFSGGEPVTALFLRVATKFSIADTLWPEVSQQIADLAVTESESAAEIFHYTIAVDSNGEYVIAQTDVEEGQTVILSQNSAGTPAGVRNGHWDDLKVYLKLNQPGSADGAIKLWVNGVLKMRYDGLNLRRGYAFGLNRLSVTSVSEPRSRTDGFQYFDDFRLYTLSAPTGFRIVTTPR